MARRCKNECCLASVYRVVVPLLVAYLLALPIGWEREVQDRSAGLRTFPLVAVASCGFILVALQFLGGKADPQSRVLYGLMTGIGFIGGGAIIKTDQSAKGTSTAASIWSTGAIGAAVAYGNYTVAVSLSIINIVTMLVLTRLKKDLPCAQPEDAPRQEDAARPKLGKADR